MGHTHDLRLLKNSAIYKLLVGRLQEVRRDALGMSLKEVTDITSKINAGSHD